MKLFIEVSKVNKKKKEKALVLAFINKKKGIYELGEKFKSKKQRLQIVEALLDLAYEIEADAEYRKNKNAG